MKGIESEFMLKLFVIKKNIKTNILEDYANFVDNTTKQNSLYFK